LFFKIITLFIFLPKKQQLHSPKMYKRKLPVQINNNNSKIRKFNEEVSEIFIN
jgi:hypothetical protein